MQIGGSAQLWKYSVWDLGALQALTAKGKRVGRPGFSESAGK